MNLFEINEEIEKTLDRFIDFETGEIKDEEAGEALNDLHIEFNTKVENIGCWIKNLKAECEALEKEEKTMAARRRALVNKMTALQNYVMLALDGRKFETAKVRIGYRKSTAVVQDKEIWEIPEDYWISKEPTLNKTAVKDALKRGEDIPGVHIEEKLSLQVR